MRAQIAIGLLFLMTGCVVDPKTFNVTNTTPVQVPMETAWNNSLRYFSANGFQIKTVEKASGVILAEKLMSDTIDPVWWHRGQVGELADCGKEFMATPGTQSVAVSVFLSQTGQQSVTAVVTAKYTETYKGLNTLYGYHEPPQPKNCNSTGKLESEIFKAIQGAS